MSNRPANAPKFLKLREGGWWLVKNNEDVTKSCLRDQQSRADKLASVIAANEKPPLYTCMGRFENSVDVAVARSGASFHNVAS